MTFLKTSLIKAILLFTLMISSSFMIPFSPSTTSHTLCYNVLASLISTSNLRSVPLIKPPLNTWVSLFIVRQWIVQNDIDYHREQRYLADFLYQEEIRKSQRYQRRLAIILSTIQDTILDCQKWQNQAKTEKGKDMQSPASGLSPT